MYFMYPFHPLLYLFSLYYPLDSASNSTRPPNPLTTLIILARKNKCFKILIFRFSELSELEIVEKSMSCHFVCQLQSRCLFLIRFSQLFFHFQRNFVDFLKNRYFCEFYCWKSLKIPVFKHFSIKKQLKQMDVTFSNYVVKFGALHCPQTPSRENADF